MRLRTIRRQLTRLLDKSGDRKIAEHRKRSAECEAAFRKLNERIPELNAAAAASGEDGVRLAQVLRAMAANHAESSLALAQWADVCESASNFAAER